MPDLATHPYSGGRKHRLRLPGDTTSVPHSDRHKSLLAEAMMPRFLIGGIVVSLFAILGDVVKPESLGGVFAAAPTIALATLVLTMHKHGGMYVAAEAMSMLAGAIAFFAYACAVIFVLMRRRPKALTTAIALLPIWFATAAGLWALWLRK